MSIDCEEQKVKVSGTVDCATLIRKLMKAGKHAELSRPRTRLFQSLQELSNWAPDGAYLPEGVRASYNQPKFASVSDRGNDDWALESYLHDYAGIYSLLGGNNNRALSVGNNTSLVSNRSV